MTEPDALDPLELIRIFRADLSHVQKFLIVTMGEVRHAMTKADFAEAHPLFGGYLCNGQLEEHMQILRRLGVVQPVKRNGMDAWILAEPTAELAVQALSAPLAVEGERLAFLEDRIDRLERTVGDLAAQPWAVIEKYAHEKVDAFVFAAEDLRAARAAEAERAMDVTGHKDRRAVNE